MMASIYFNNKQSDNMVVTRILSQLLAPSLAVWISKDLIRKQDLACPTPTHAKIFKRPDGLSHDAFA
jgi:hypothetical protein